MAAGGNYTVFHSLDLGVMWIPPTRVPGPAIAQGGGGGLPSGRKACGCTEQDMFQHTTSSAEMIREIRLVIAGGAGDDLTYLHKVGK